ncbi:MAG: anti-sigma factor family protein [Nocardioides sp.]
MNTTHPIELLGGHALGELDAAEERLLREHLDSCATCRDAFADIIEASLALEGIAAARSAPVPSDSADRVLAGALERVRAERPGTDRAAGRTRAVSSRPARRSSRSNRFVLAACAALLAAVTGLGGLWAGTQLADEPDQNQELVAGRSFESSNAATGVSLTGAVTPKAGWVEVTISTQGIDPGVRCRIYVVDQRGRRSEAGSWTTAPNPRGPVVTSVAVDPARVARIEIETFDGEPLVSAEA